MRSMSRWSRAAALIAAVALAVVLVAVPSMAMAVPVATVQGTITNSSAGLLSGIHVTIQGEILSAPFWADAVTGPGGTYTFGVPEAGDYQVAAVDPGGTYLTETNYLTNVTSGIVVSNFTLSRPGTISGSVTDAITHAALQHIQVQTNRLMPGWEAWDGTAYTDQYGAYTAAGLYPGPHSVYYYDGSGRAAPYSPQWYNGATSFGAATPVAVVENANTPGIDAALASGAVLGGRVTDAVSGTPLGSMIVTLQDDFGNDLVWTSTDANGFYRVLGTPAGTYTVTVYGPPAAAADDYANTSQSVELTDNQVLTNLNFALTPAAAGYMSGTVVDGAAAPISGVEVGLAMGLPSDNNPVEFSTVTTGSGGFLLPPRTGQVTLHFSDPTGKHPQLVTSLTAAGPSALGNFVLSATGKISGTVSDLNAQPIAGAVVFLWNAADAVAPIDSATTGVDGSYSFGELADGGYRLSFNADTYQSEYFDNAQTFAGSTMVTIAAGNATVADAVLSRPDTITGMVTDINSVASVNTLVEIWHVGPSGLELSGFATTDVSGGFSVGSLVSGDYLIRLSGGLGAGYVIPGGQWVTAFSNLAQHYTFADSLLPQTQVVFVRYAFDAVAPSVGVAVTAAHSAAPWYSAPATVTLTPTDAGSGVGQTFYTIDGGPTLTYTGPFPISASGTHVVSRWASDNVGNVSVAATSPVDIDVTAPAPSIVVASAQTSGTWHSSPTTVTLSATDAQSGVASISYTVDAGAPQTYTGPFPLSADGTHTVTYWAIDNVANESAHVPELVGIDAVAPAPAIVLASSQTSGAWRSSPVNVTLSATDAESGVGSISYTVDAGAPQTYSGAFDVSADGVHTVTYWAIDNVGNESAHVPQTVSVDAVAPAVSPIAFTAVSNVGDWYSSPATVTLAATDGESGVAQILYTVNGGSTQVYGTPFAVTASGVYTFEYWAVDNVGNEATHQTATVFVGTSVALFTGTVTDGTAPLAGMHVVIQRVFDPTPIDPVGPYWEEFTTGADGVFSFGVPEPGDYSVRVDDPNGVYADATRVGTVAVGQTAVLDFALGAKGGISGSVVAASNSAPLQSIQVDSLLLGGDFEYWDGTARTNPYGVYSISDVTPGAHVVSFTDPSDRAVPYADQYYNGVTDIALATTVTVLPAATTPGINASMLAGTVISGTVTDSVSGLPVGGTIINVLNDFTPDELWTSTAPDGTYRVVGSVFGTYTVQALSQTGDYVDQAAQNVVLSAAQRAQVVNFALVPSVPGYLTGRVVDGAAAPIAGVEVSLANGVPTDNAPIGYSTVTAADGTFSLPPRTGAITLRFLDPSGTHPALTTSVVAAGTGALGDFVLGDAGTISGTVRDAGGQPIDGAFVKLFDAADPVAPLDSATVGLAGTFRFGDLPAGDYKLSFEADGYVPEFFDNAFAFSTATAVTVPAGGDVTASAVLSPAGTITGVVTDIAGSPSVGTTVELWHVGPLGLELAGTTVSGPGGAYSVGSLVSGDYLIRLSGGLGAGYVIPGGQWLTSSSTLAARYNVPDSVTPVTVNAPVRYAFDAVAPVVGIAVTAAHSSAPWYSQPATVTLTATDADSGVLGVFYSIDGGGTQTYTGPFQISAPGTHVVSRWATDNVGNTSVAATTAVDIDVTAPTPSVTVESVTTFGTWHSAPTTVTIFAEDLQSGVAGMTYAIDGGAPQAYAGAFPISSDGTHTVTYWATDNVGNESAHLAEVIGIDSAPPVPSIAVEPVALFPDWYAQTVTVTLSATDPESGVDQIFYTLDAGAPQVYGGPFQISDTGTHTVTYWATDNIGNESAHLPQAVNIDETAPTVSTIAFSAALHAGSWYSAPMTVTLAATDAQSGIAQILYTDNGGATQSYTAPFAVSAVGQHVFVYWAVDNAGNTAPTQTATVFVGSPAATISGTVSNAAGPLAGIHVVIQGGSIVEPYWQDVTTGANGTYTFSVPEPGDYTVRADDPSGAYADEQRLVSGVTFGQNVTGVDFLLGTFGSISGSVTDSATTDPVVAVDVMSLRLAGDFEYWDGSALTDPYGNYTMSGVAPGPHAVLFTDLSARALPYADQWFDLAVDQASATTVTVGSGANTSGIDAKLVAGTMISGTVLDTNGVPVGKEIITIQDDAGPDLYWTSTAADGTYRVPGLPFGSYSVQARSVTLDYADQETAGVVLAVDQTSQVVDFTLVPAVFGYLNGRAVDGSAVPLDGIEVSLAMGLPSDNNPVEALTITNGSGQFNLPPRTGVITLRFLDPTGAHPSLVTTITAAGPAALGDFVLGSTATISGSVHDVNATPLPGTFVSLWRASDSVAPIDTMFVGLDGRYSFGSLDAGDYKVSFSSDVYAPEYFDNAMTFAHATTITVGVGTAASADATLSKPATISGTITAFPTGLAVGATVRAFRFASDGTLELAGTAVTNGAGFYSIDLLTGDYLVQLEGNGFIGYVTSGRVWLTSDVDSAEVFTIADALDPVTVTVNARLAIDETAPDVAIALAAAHEFDPWYSQPVTVSIVTSDAIAGIDHVFYQLDGGAVTTYTAPFQVTGESSHTVTAWASDILGNVSTPIDRTFAIDLTAPVVTASADPGAVGAWYPATAVTLTATDGGSGVAASLYTVNGGAVTTYTTPITLDTSNHYEIVYWAVDHVANASDNQTMSLDVDADAPTTPDNFRFTAIHPTNVHLAWMASTDPLSGVDHYDVFVDGVLFDSTTGTSIVVTGLDPNTSYSLTVVAVDAVGNTSDAATLDVTTPASEVTLPVPVGTNQVVVIDVPFNGQMRPFTFTFANVTGAGTLSVTPLGPNKPDFANLPGGLRTVGGYYDVSFTGTFTGSVQVTIPYDDRLPDFRAATLELLHWTVDSTPDVVDVTVNTSAHTVTFTLTSLSPIVLVEPAANSAVTTLSASWLGTTATTAYPAYGASMYIRGHLRAADGSELYSGAVVDVEKFIGGVWTPIGQATRSSSGLYSFRVSTKVLALYRFSYAGDPVNDAVASRTLTLKPHYKLSLNSLRSSYSHRTTYTFSGTIAPLQAAGSTTVVYVKLYRFTGGHWKYSSKVTARIGASGTTFSARIRLRRVARWKLVAHAVSGAQNTTTNSSARYTRAN